MAFFNEAWFIHGVSDNVTQLAQQKISKVMGAMRSKEGVVGKTWPFNRISSIGMVEMTTRDADTAYLNPAQSKRRAVLRDFGAAVLIEDFDEVKTLTNPQSEHAQILAYSRNRQIDDLAIGIAGLGTAGADGGTNGGALGAAASVDEAGETTSRAVLPGAQQIVDGGTNLTMAKIRTTNRIFNAADVDEDDRYFFYSPIAMEKLLSDSTVTSADYSTIQALTRGGFPMDQTFMNMKWRMSTRLPKTGNIRSCIAWQQNAVGYAAAGVKELNVSQAPHKWNNTQVIAKLSAGVVRIDDLGVIQINVDETA